MEIFAITEIHFIQKNDIYFEHKKLCTFLYFDQRQKKKISFCMYLHYAFYLEQENLNYAYLSVTLYTHVPKRPSVPVEH